MWTSPRNRANKSITAVRIVKVEYRAMESGTGATRRYDDVHLLIQHQASSEADKVEHGIQITCLRDPLLVGVLKIDSGSVL